MLGIIRTTVSNQRFFKLIAKIKQTVGYTGNEDNEVINLVEDDQESQKVDQRAQPRIVVPDIKTDMQAFDRLPSPLQKATPSYEGIQISEIIQQKLNEIETATPNAQTPFRASLGGVPTPDTVNLELVKDLTKEITERFENLN